MQLNLPRRSVWSGILASAPVPILVAVTISLCVIAVALSLDRRNSEFERTRLHAQVEEAATTIARRLTWRIDADMSTGRFLARNLVQHPQNSTENTSAFIDMAFERHPHFAALAFAPGFRLTDIRFPDGARGNISLSPFNRDQLAADLSAAAAKPGPAIITGSQENHLTVVIPVAVSEAKPALMWGAIAIVIDKAALFRASGMALDSTAEVSGLTDFTWLDLALRDTEKPEYLAFAGNDAVETLAPSTRTIKSGDVSWNLMVVPKSGWNVAPENQNMYRLLLTLGALAIIISMVVAAYLISERNRNIAELKARESNLLDLSQRFNLAMEASNIGIWEVSGDGHDLYWDRRAEILHGKEFGIGVHRVADLVKLVAAEDRHAAEAHFLRCAELHEPCSETYRIKLPNGSVRHLRSAGARYENGDGSQQTTGIVWDVTADMLMAQTLRDSKENTEIKNAELELALDELSDREKELEELSSRLDLALASYGCGIWEFDPALGAEIWDARMCQLYGVAFTDGIIPKERWFDLIMPEDRTIALNACHSYLDGNTREALLVRVPQPDGTIRYIRSVGQLQTAKNGAKKLIGLAFDVTKDAEMTIELQKAKTEADAKNAELELAKSRIEHNALHDPLTLLANRRKLDMELDRLSRSANRERFSILHLDLDRFKQINDTLGHAAGDAMLVHASRILARNVSNDDLVARIGGDEFVILIHGICSSDELSALSERIVGEFRHPVDFEGFSCRCGVSIGIAQANGVSVDARRILVNADLALYRAKGLGRNRYEFFTQNLHAEIIDHKRTADELLAAIENDEMSAWYQPQFCARTNTLTGVEALIRWNHPHRGIVAPDSFLKIAEDLNVTATLDHIVLQTVLKDKMRWAAMGIRIPKVSVNVSSKRLHDAHLIDTLRGLQITPGEIAFELVESIFLDESDRSVVNNLEAIKELGIDVEIDDFGTGHTSIVSLLKLKPKRLKIDRQLVQPIIGSSQERALVRSIIDIARSLGVETIAEGVESFEHADLLRELGCDLLQGYAFGRPMPFDSFTNAARKGWERVAA